MDNQIEKQALGNIFEDNSVKTSYGKIIEKINSRKFRVLDDLENTVIVRADRDWSIGTFVIIQNGFIMGTGKRAGSFKVFRV